MQTLLQKLERMELHLREFIGTLEASQELDVHRHINQFFYMERAAEIKLLMAQMQEALRTTDRIKINMESIYVLTFAHWQKDARWLNRHQHVSAQRVREISR